MAARGGERTLVPCHFLSSSAAFPQFSPNNRHEHLLCSPRCSIVDSVRIGHGKRREVSVQISLLPFFAIQLTHTTLPFHFPFFSANHSAASSVSPQASQVREADLALARAAKEGIEMLRWPFWQELRWLFWQGQQSWGGSGNSGKSSGGGGGWS